MIDYKNYTPLTARQMLAYARQSLKRGYIGESCQWVDLLCEKLLAEAK